MRTTPSSNLRLCAPHRPLTRGYAHHTVLQPAHHTVLQPAHHTVLQPAHHTVLQPKVMRTTPYSNPRLCAPHPHLTRGYAYHTVLQPEAMRNTRPPTRGYVRPSALKDEVIRNTRLHPRGYAHRPSSDTSYSWNEPLRFPPPLPPPPFPTERWIHSHGKLALPLTVLGLQMVKTEETGELSGE